jgi:SAM-dependent methyltransferase
VTTAVDRATFAAALDEARLTAYPRGEHVGQESFMTAGEIRALAERAGISQRARVLDLCCGVAGPGRLVAAETGCDYLGVDEDPTAIAAARAAAEGLRCRFEVRRVPPVPAGEVDVVLMLETLLAFRDKQPLVAAVAERLRPGGRFALTVEEGPPLTESEREQMPASDTVWPIPLSELLALLEGPGLRVRSVDEHSRAHRAVAAALADAFEQHRPRIAAAIGERAIDDLITAHRCWVRWLDSGRMRKLSLVAVR